jgi:hypothetical protein
MGGKKDAHRRTFLTIHPLREGVFDRNAQTGTSFRPA